MICIQLQSLKGWLLTVCLVAVLVTVVSAQIGTRVQVMHNVNLRVDPSTIHAPITLLHPPADLELLATNQVSGYFHVRTGDGKEGWVWAKNVSAIGTATATATLAPATTISSGWAKSTSLNTTFQGLEGPCPFNGNGSDPDQFTLKNRADTPQFYHDVTWDVINNLPFPGKTDGHYAKPHRKDWKQSELNVIRPFEGVPVRVVGYVVAIKPQSGGSGEGTNCNFNQTGDVDTHIALVRDVGGAEKNSIVIE
jgi:hypothetical protein